MRGFRRWVEAAGDELGEDEEGLSKAMLRAAGELGTDATVAEVSHACFDAGKSLAIALRKGCGNVEVVIPAAAALSSLYSRCPDPEDGGPRFPMTECIRAVQEGVRRWTIHECPVGLPVALTMVASGLYDDVILGDASFSVNELVDSLSSVFSQHAIVLGMSEDPYVSLDAVTCASDVVLSLLSSRSLPVGCVREGGLLKALKQTWECELDRALEQVGSGGRVGEVAFVLGERGRGLLPIASALRALERVMGVSRDRREGEGEGEGEGEDEGEDEDGTDRYLVLSRQIAEGRFMEGLDEGLMMGSGGGGESGSGCDVGEKKKEKGSDGVEEMLGVEICAVRMGASKVVGGKQALLWIGNGGLVPIRAVAGVSGTIEPGALEKGAITVDRLARAGGQNTSIAVALCGGAEALCEMIDDYDPNVASAALHAYNSLLSTLMHPLHLSQPHSILSKLTAAIPPHPSLWRLVGKCTSLRTLCPEASHQAAIRALLTKQALTRVLLKIDAKEKRHGGGEGDDGGGREEEEEGGEEGEGGEGGEGEEKVKWWLRADGAKVLHAAALLSVGHVRNVMSASLPATLASIAANVAQQWKKSAVEKAVEVEEDEEGGVESEEEEVREDMVEVVEGCGWAASLLVCDWRSSMALPATRDAREEIVHALRAVLTDADISSLNEPTSPEARMVSVLCTFGAEASATPTSPSHTPPPPSPPPSTAAVRPSLEEMLTLLTLQVPYLTPPALKWLSCAPLLPPTPFIARLLTCCAAHARPVVTASHISPQVPPTALSALVLASNILPYLSKSSPSAVWVGVADVAASATSILTLLASTHPVFLDGHAPMPSSCPSDLADWLQHFVSSPVPITTQPPPLSSIKASVNFLRTLCHVGLACDAVAAGALAPLIILADDETPWELEGWPLEVREPLARLAFATIVSMGEDGVLELLRIIDAAASSIGPRPSTDARLIEASLWKKKDEDDNESRSSRDVERSTGEEGGGGDGGGGELERRGVDGSDELPPDPSHWLALCLPTLNGVVLGADVESSSPTDDAPSLAQMLLWEDASASKPSPMVGGFVPLIRALAASSSPLAVVSAASTLASIVHGAPHRVRSTCAQLGAVKAAVAAVAALQADASGAEGAARNAREARGEAYACLETLCAGHAGNSQLLADAIVVVWDLAVLDAVPDDENTMIVEEVLLCAAEALVERVVTDAPPSSSSTTPIALLVAKTMQAIATRRGWSSATGARAAQAWRTLTGVDSGRGAGLPIPGRE